MDAIGERIKENASVKAEAAKLAAASDAKRQAGRGLPWGLGHLHDQAQRSVAPHADQFHHRCAQASAGRRGQGSLGATIEALEQAGLPRGDVIKLAMMEAHGQSERHRDVGRCRCAAPLRQDLGRKFEAVGRILTSDASVSAAVRQHWNEYAKLGAESAQGRAPRTPTSLPSRCRTAMAKARLVARDILNSIIALNNEQLEAAKHNTADM